jgi:carboxypeptidase C (cathepsin A)
VLISPGPGCSILHNWLYSKGEFVFTRNTIDFRRNDYNWNKQANVLYLEGPAGTGFSYGQEDNITDNSTSIEYYRAILRFYEKFPELKDQRMYLSGFGYAGIIAPKLALNIIERNRNPDTPAWIRVNISGLLLFNPCTLPEECDSTFEFNQFTVKALRNNFFIDAATFDDYTSHCTLRTPSCAKAEQSIASNFKIAGADLHNLFK